MSIFQPAPEPPSKLGVYRVLSPRAGVRVSPICLGAMSIGTDQKWTKVDSHPFDAGISDLYLSDDGIHGQRDGYEAPGYLLRYGR